MVEGRRTVLLACPSEEKQQQGFFTDRLEALSYGRSMLEILYDNGPCLIVNKPAGLLTQAPRGIDSLEIWVKDFYRQREGKSPDDKIYLGLAHRIDRPVTGAIVFGRHVRAARKLCTQFADRTVSKVYWAFVEGQVSPDEGTWRDYLHKQHGMAQAEVVEADYPAAKHAVLHYRVLSQSEMCQSELGQGELGQGKMGQGKMGSWLEIVLETGRTHQIRIQAASRGHAVVGDSQYGSTIPFGVQYPELRDRGIALHARQLGFTHPMSGEPVDVIAPLPTSWDALRLPER